jgi:hypothetical protein
VLFVGKWLRTSTPIRCPAIYLALFRSWLSYVCFTRQRTEVKEFFFLMDGRRIPIVKIPGRILVVSREKHGKAGGSGTGAPRLLP